MRWRASSVVPVVPCRPPRANTTDAAAACPHAAPNAQPHRSVFTLSYAFWIFYLCGHSESDATLEFYRVVRLVFVIFSF